MSEKLFQTEPKHPKQDPLQKAFSNYYIVEYNGKYILQLGLVPHFDDADSIGKEFPVSQLKILKKIMNILAQLELVPNNCNFILVGNNISRPFITDEQSETVIQCDMRAGNYLAIGLDSIHSKLASKLENLGLYERGVGPYSIYETVTSDSDLIGQPYLGISFR